MGARALTPAWLALALLGTAAVPPALAAAPGQPASERPASEQAAPPADAGRAATARPIPDRPVAVAAEDLESRSVYAPDGSRLGDIEDIVVDPVSGRIVYAVVELGGFLGIGERSFPVPWALMKPAPEGDRLVLDVSADRMKGAPQFTRSNRPDMTDPQWATAVHAYYGVPPYWSAEAVAANRDTTALRQEVQRLSQEVDRLHQALAAAAPPPPAGTEGASSTPAPGGSGSDSPAPPPP